MKNKYENEYKLEGRSLYKLVENDLGQKSWIHIAVVPPNLSLTKAVDWYFSRYNSESSYGM